MQVLTLRGMTGRVRPRWRRDSGVYFQPFSNPYGTTRESPYRLDGRRVEGSDWRHFTARPFPTPILIRTNRGSSGWIRSASAQP